MNTNVNFTKIQRRNHRALFDDNLPFSKPKVEKSKKQYRRKNKHILKQVLF